MIVVVEGTGWGKGVGAAEPMAGTVELELGLAGGRAGAANQRASIATVPLDSRVLLDSPGEDSLMHKLVAAGATGVIAAAMFLSVTAYGATGSGASGCQPAAGPRTAAIAQALGGLGGVASVIARSEPGAIAALNQEDLFSCT